MVSFTVTGAGCGKVNGQYRAKNLPKYRGAETFGNGTVFLFRWHRQHWVLRCAIATIDQPLDNFCALQTT